MKHTACHKPLYWNQHPKWWQCCRLATIPAYLCELPTVNQKSILVKQPNVKTNYMWTTHEYGLIKEIFLCSYGTYTLYEPLDTSGPMS